MSLNPREMKQLRMIIRQELDIALNPRDPLPEEVAAVEAPTPDPLPEEPPTEPDTTKKPKVHGNPSSK